jgi:hypothetical protein
MHITGCPAEHTLLIAAPWISTNDSGLCCTQLLALQGRHQLLQPSMSAPALMSQFCFTKLSVRGSYALVSSQKEYQLTSMMNH